MNVEYIARITCACGTKCEVPAEMGSETRGHGYGSYDVGVFECREPDGWLGGYNEENPYMCPDCVKVKYA
jgi:hypothetical protein